MSDKEGNSGGDNPFENEEYSMFNKSYQATRARQAAQEKGTYGYIDAMCISIFKNCMHIFVCVLIISVLGMYIIVLEGQKNSSLDQAWKGHIEKMTKFIDLHPMTYGLKKQHVEQDGTITDYKDGLNEYLYSMTKTKVINQRSGTGILLHPVFAELQDKSPMVKNENYQIPEIDCDQVELTKRDFYLKHLSKSEPLIMKNYSKDWSIRRQISEAVEAGKARPGALNEWLQNMFSVVFGQSIKDGIIEFSRIKKGSNGKFEYPDIWNSRSIDYKNFTASWKNFTIVSERMDPNQFIHYVEGLKLSPYGRWNEELSKEKVILHDILDFRMRTFTLWQGNFQRQPKMKEYESLYCVMEGTEQYRIVSPIFRDNLYVGHFENWPPHEATYSLFGDRKKELLLSSNVKYFDATLEKGDCLYVPAYFYAESKTLSKDGKGISIIINHQYTSHSKLVDMVMDGIQEHDLLGGGERQGKVDKMLTGYLENVLP